MKQAIRSPLQNSGEENCDEAIDLAVQTTQGYPYFVQALGRELWLEAANGPVGCAGARAAVGRFCRLRDELYNDRCGALDEADAAASLPLTWRLSLRPIGSQGMPR